MYNIFCFFRPDGVVVPMGTSKDTGISNPMGYTLNYNGKCTKYILCEYISVGKAQCCSVLLSIWIEPVP